MQYLTPTYSGMQSQPNVMQPGASPVPGANYGVEFQAVRMPQDADVVSSPNQIIKFVQLMRHQRRVEILLLPQRM
jgi:hypothetical protein